MAFSPNTTLPGASTPNFTTPTYALTVDTPPNGNSKQWYVSGLGGTQAGVTSHQVSKPFTLTAERPAILRSAGTPNPSTGVISSNPVNVYKFRTRKGGKVDASGDNIRIAMIETKVHVPAGMDSAEAEELEAMVACHIGALDDTSSGIYTTLTTGGL